MWKKNKLRDLAVLNYGRALKTETRRSGNIPVYSSAGLSGYHDTPLVDSKAIIIGRKGTIGKVYKTEGPFYCIDTAYYILPNDDKYDFDFLFYLLQTLGFQELNEDSAVPGLNRDTAYEQSLLLPSITEQKNIAKTLKSLDDKISLLAKQNKTLEDMSFLLYKKWLVDLKTNSTLKEYIKIQGGYAFKSKDFLEDGEIGIIKITNISSGAVDIENTQFVNPETIKNVDAGRFKINSGDFLIAMTGAEIGKIGIVENTSKNIWLNQRVGKLVSKVPYGSFIGYLALQSSEGQDHILNTCSGSAQENISSSGIEEMALPSYDQLSINKLGGFIEPFFKKINANAAQIKKLSQLRNELLPKFVSGELRIKN